MPTDFLAVFTALAAADARFVVAGGLAVVLHGHDRLTADIDLAIDLTPESARIAITVLTQLGYRPLAPVDPLQLADAAERGKWQRERNMQVFSFWDAANSMPTVDVFLAPTIAFEDLWRDASIVQLGGVAVRIASRAHLIAMKRAAGRPQDLADIERLQS